MNTPTRSPAVALIEKLVPGIRYPWLLAILAGLLLVDMVTPDPIFLVDEVILALLTFLVASWRTRDDDRRPPPRDVTPPDEAAGSLPDQTDPPHDQG
jgi:hypothetical protein